MNAFFFWTSWSTVTNRPGEDVTYTSNWPSRAAGRQRADHADVHLDVRQHPVPARRHRRARAGTTRRRTARSAPPVVPDSDPLQEPAAHALDEGHGQVLLGRHRADRGADHPRRHHRALRGRRPGVLRLPARRVPAVRRDAQLAPAARRCCGSPPRGSPPACTSRRPISGHEPKFQRFGVNFLFTCLLDHRGRRASAGSGSP